MLAVLAAAAAVDFVQVKAQTMPYLSPDGTGGIKELHIPLMLGAVFP
jgi:hypothetical protein